MTLRIETKSARPLRASDTGLPTRPARQAPSCVARRPITGGAGFHEQACGVSSSWISGCSASCIKFARWLRRKSVEPSSHDSLLLWSLRGRPFGHPPFLAFLRAAAVFLSLLALPPILPPLRPISRIA